MIHRIKSWDSGHPKVSGPAMPAPTSPNHTGLDIKLPRPPIASAHSLRCLHLSACGSIASSPATCQEPLDQHLLHEWIDAILSAQFFKVALVHSQHLALPISDAMFLNSLVQVTFRACQLQQSLDPVFFGTASLETFACTHLLQLISTLGFKIFPLLREDLKHLGVELSPCSPALGLPSQNGLHHGLLAGDFQAATCCLLLQFLFGQCLQVCPSCRDLFFSEHCLKQCLHQVFLLARTLQAARTQGLLQLISRHATQLLALRCGSLIPLLLELLLLLAVGFPLDESLNQVAFDNRCRLLLALLFHRPLKTPCLLLMPQESLDHHLCYERTDANFTAPLLQVCGAQRGQLSLPLFANFLGQGLVDAAFLLPQVQQLLNSQRLCQHSCDALRTAELLKFLGRPTFQVFLLAYQHCSDLGFMSSLLRPTVGFILDNGVDHVFLLPCGQRFG
mmetsp:Transcript_18521/g.34733  ORF Transcript_18521/g.34733 Transcript_18521/m.34733 type:complete len:448 (-) Transcript_18521:182-1525(-)